MYAHLEEPTSHVPISVTTSDIALEPDDSHLHSKASGNGIRHRILSLSPSYVQQIHNTLLTLDCFSQLWAQEFYQS